MSFEFQPAKREDVRLLLGVAGSTGAGKTMSALRLATGLGGGERFALIDTENGRAQHYADDFKFDHGDLRPPFTPARYAAAIQAADEAGYPVIVVDSASHEHAGDGGLLDMHEQVLQRMAGNDWRKRDACSMAAWVEPKREHKAMVARLLQLHAHVILCFRAEAKVEMAKEGDKTIIRPKRSLIGVDGWLPITEKNLPFELTLSLLFTSDQPGIPKPIKLQEQHRLLVPLDQPLGEDTGVALAAWARGDQKKDERTSKLLADLLKCADELGNRETITAAVQKNRRQHADNPKAHATWLEKQLTNAQAKVSEKQAKEEAEPVA